MNSKTEKAGTGSPRPRWQRITAAAIIAAVIFSAGLGAWRSVPTQAASTTITVGEPVDTSLLLQVLGLVQANYVDNIDAKTLMEGALKGLVEATGDPHSEFLLPSELTDLNSSLEGTYAGIGIEIEMKDGYVTVVAPFQGSPAEKAGLKAGDRILKVDGNAVSDLNAASAAIRGQPGTPVTLTVSRPGDKAPFDVTITRATITINPVSTSYVDNGKIGVLRLSSFQDNATIMVDAALREFQAKGVQGIILDLRNDPGGLLDQAISVAGRFMPVPAVVVRVHGRGGAMVTYKSDQYGNKLPLVILVNEGTASAAEIVTAAIHAYGWGTVVGTRTYGKGTVQSIMDLPGGYGLRLTIARYTDPHDRQIDGVGITPDVEVPDPVPPDPTLHYLDGHRLVSRGLVGLDVLELQQVLDTLGYDIGTPNGVFGPKTQAAVRAWQKAAGRPVTGSIKKDDVAFLQSAYAKALQAKASADPQMDAAVKILESKLKGQ